ncbi:RNA polymerase sigma factor [Prevotella pallens]|jgi:RNA polymerase sigma factor, sigma-70 family|uniref:RNA polymerase sigma factor CnrH n=3 Tax=Prevotella pallens TaxID=60133 RepID=A0A379F162_9BACT|nr:sigma-70 family RNA polymerase sigma factor [Prevotella pallens]EGQ18115.1 RNA polymerase ECF-type sigma factor [Prevotella pallens ATCC 700821]MBF1450640.1 sigma-70 family RNA polymerase sigma factor [Prevotella pallens]MBF1460935.1 sigma-70 family RNA polymerase sigma factor [Prevotella pallens]MBF1462593.1 sigma-70 family RNA polymerase sigma factor [Prevotella pallens]MBF1464373.1 sigma-70 family RNA polymerase sigma factor [Prevotella pallens]
MKNLNEMTDEELALLYINGNNRAFDLLLSHNQSKLFSYILFVVRNRDVADDIFQETFVKIITKLQQGCYKPSGKFSAWAMRIAHNIIMDWYRAQKTDKIVEPTKENDLSNLGSADIQIGNIENQFVNMQTLADIKKLMQHLPPSQREVVFMRFYQEMSFKEIAKATGVSINTSLGRMRYAILNLRKMVRENDVLLQLAY